MKYLNKYDQFKLNESSEFVTNPDEIKRIIMGLSLRGYMDLRENWFSENVTIREDGTVDVTGDMNIYAQFPRLPIKFGRVTGRFLCSGNNLTTMVGFPDYVGGNLMVENNFISNMEGFPKYVGNSVSFSRNKLTSLEGLPDTINGNLELSFNKLESLKGCPRIVLGHLLASYNYFTDLVGSPEEIGHDFFIQSSPNLTSIKGLTPNVGGQVQLIGCPKLYMMEKWEGDCEGGINFKGEYGENNDILPPNLSEDECCPIQQVRQLFESFKDFNDSLDYKYFKMVGGRPAIILWRFEEALAEFDLPFPKKKLEATLGQIDVMVPLNPPSYHNIKEYGDFGVYIYVDDSGARIEGLKDKTGLLPWNKDPLEEWEEWDEDYDDDGENYPVDDYDDEEDDEEDD